MVCVPVDEAAEGEPVVRRHLYRNPIPLTMMGMQARETAARAARRSKRPAKREGCNWKLDIGWMYAGGMRGWRDGGMKGWRDGGMEG